MIRLDQETNFRGGLNQFQKFRGSCFRILCIWECIHVLFFREFITIINVDFAKIPPK